MQNSADRGHYNIDCWRHTNRFEGCTADAINCAAQAGQVQVVKFLHQHRQLRCSEAAVDYAANHDRFAVIEWIIQHDPRFANYIYERLINHLSPPTRPLTPL